VSNCRALEVSPATITLSPGASQQFTATFARSPTTAVLWSASGGSIDATGLYTAPAQGGNFTVTATSEAIAGVQGNAAVTVPVPAARFEGTLTLDSVNGGSGIVNRTRINVAVVAEVESHDSRGIIVLREITGTGSDTYTYDSNVTFCVSGAGSVPANNRPDEGTSGIVTSASFGDIADGVPGLRLVLRPRVTGTETHNSCSNGIWTSRTEAVTDETLSNGQFTGTVVVVDGKTRTIDFNRDFTDEFGRRTVTTGQLTRR